MDDYVTVTKLTDPVVSSIPAGEAREVMPPTVVRMSLDEMLDGIFKPSIFERVKGKKMDQAKVDPNAAMIARDEVPDGSATYYVGNSSGKDFGGLVFPADVDCVWASDDGITFSRLERKPGVKPAITGLTTVHGGKERGLGFCCDA